LRESACLIGWGVRDAPHRLPVHERRWIGRVRAG
jgi:hypothetical protein